MNQRLASSLLAIPSDASLPPFPPFHLLPRSSIPPPKRTATTTTRNWRFGMSGLSPLKEEWGSRKRGPKELAPEPASREEAALEEGNVRARDIR